MAASNDDLIEKQLVQSVLEAIKQQKIDDEHCLLIRFFTDLQTVNSKAYQKNIAVGARPARAVLASEAAKHMYLGQTDNSYFISFSEDIQVLLNAVSSSLGADVSTVVRSIIKGLNPQFQNKPALKNITFTPAKYVGIFKVKKADIVSWADKDLQEEVALLVKKDPKNQDLKHNYKAEHEVVAYYPGPVENPVVQLENPFYDIYMTQIPKV